MKHIGSILNNVFIDEIYLPCNLDLQDKITNNFKANVANMVWVLITEYKIDSREQY